QVELLVSLKYDNELTTLPDNSCEVLIGNTNRLASENAEDELKSNDYLCRWDDGALVICGKSDAATIKAIDKFISDVLPTASPYSLMHEDAHFELFNEYTIKKIILNGYDLYDYILVYDSAQKANERKMAEALRDFINSKSGYLLKVVSSDDLKSNSGRTIKIAMSKNATDKALIVSEENGLSITGNDSYSLSRAVAELAKGIKNGVTDGRAELKYAERTEVADVETAFKSIYYFVKRGDGTSFKPIDDFLKLLQTSEFGVLFLGNPDSAIYDALTLNSKEWMKTSKLTIGAREVLLIYDSRKVSKITVTVDEAGTKASAVVEAPFGETLRFVYAVSGGVEAVDENSVIFAEKSGKISCVGASSIADGTLEASVGKLEYCLLADNNLCVKEGNINVTNGEEAFCCSVTTDIVYSSGYLNDALK
ncbi:MAG: hypothetical protein J6U68_00575, partial [Clostridia bacterium]|nr:hypothetical protein [Clostridia bacterium]